MGTARMVREGVFRALMHESQALPAPHLRLCFTFDSCVPQISHNLFRLVASMRAPATPSNGAPSNHQSTHQEQDNQRGFTSGLLWTDGENSPGP